MIILRLSLEIKILFITYIIVYIDNLVDQIRRLAMSHMAHVVISYRTINNHMVQDVSVKERDENSIIDELHAN